MLYLLFAHPQQNEANKLNVLINPIIIFTHRWKNQTLLTIKQFNAFDVNMATQKIIITGKDRKIRIFFNCLTFNIYTLIFTASYNINNILPDL